LRYDSIAAGAHAPKGRLKPHSEPNRASVWTWTPRALVSGEQSSRLTLRGLRIALPYSYSRENPFPSWTKANPRRGRSRCARLHCPPEEAQDGRATRGCSRPSWPGTTRDDGIE